MKVEEWQKDNPQSSFFFRPQSVGDDGKENDFLYVHQEQWQKDFIKKYGREIIFLDATYRTTKYALPLFIMAVQTNVGYFPVAEFIIYSETKERIKEALKIIRDWSVNWQIPYGMADYSEAEISALEEVFDGMIVYICDFHREQAWTRWSRKNESGLSYQEQEQFLSHMRSIALSFSWDDLCKRLNALKGSLLWEKQSVKSYVSRYWFPLLHRWVKFYRNPLIDRSVTTNNGVESLNKVLKHMYLKYYCDRTVTGLVTMLLNTFLPERYQLYAKENNKLASTITTYNANIPTYLHERPHNFVKHMLKRQDVAKTIRKSNIKCEDNSERNFQIYITNTWK